MEKYPFMTHRIKRGCKVRLGSYEKYRGYLEQNFGGRCCYCNMHMNLITEPFHIDHFIPRKAFVGKKDYLRDCFDNLMWACPKCNMAKGDAYDGDLEHDDSITNTLFYNPTETDYNTIFYRNYMGGIQSDDEKGKAMIKRLKLYRPLYHMAWLLEEYEKLCDVINKKEELEHCPEKKILLKNAGLIVHKECLKLERLFRIVYSGKKGLCIEAFCE